MAKTVACEYESALEVKLYKFLNLAFWCLILAGPFYPVCYKVAMVLFFVLLVVRAAISVVRICRHSLAEYRRDAFFREMRRHGEPYYTCRK